MHTTEVSTPVGKTCNFHRQRLAKLLTRLRTGLKPDHIEELCRSLPIDYIALRMMGLKDVKNPIRLAPHDRMLYLALMLETEERREQVSSLVNRARQSVEATAIKLRQVSEIIVEDLPTESSVVAGLLAEEGAAPIKPDFAPDEKVAVAEVAQ